VAQQQLPDRVFAEPLANIERFAFNDDVASVFSDMIERSVPGYRSIVTQTGLLTARFAVPDSCCYDLGCSLGDSAFAMRHQLNKLDAKNKKGISVVAVDNSSAMLARLKQKLLVADRSVGDGSVSDGSVNNSSVAYSSPVDSTAKENAVVLRLIEADITDLAFDTCSVAVLNFTLQFIPIEKRQALITALAAQLLPGGALILSEKVHFDDSQQQKLHQEMYENFKRANGYSELEISQKRDALENVLVPETLQTHKKRLLNAGFNSVEVWFQCFNFLSIVALK